MCIMYILFLIKAFEFACLITAVTCSPIKRREFVHCVWFESFFYIELKFEARNYFLHGFRENLDEFGFEFLSYINRKLSVQILEIFNLAGRRI